MTTYSAELFAHVVAFVAVSAMLVAGALVLGLVGKAITAGTRYRGWASDRPSLPSGPGSPWQRLPDRRPAWRRSVWIGTRLLAAAPRFVASVVRFFLRPSPLTFIALLVVVGYRDGKALLPLVSSTLGDLSTRWPMLSGAIFVASTVVVTLRRPRLRPLTTRQHAHEDACICALEEMLQSARVAAFQMWRIGDEAVENLRQELMSYVELVSGGACRLGTDFRVELLPPDQRRLLRPESAPVWRDHALLKSAAASIRRERDRLNQRDQMAMIWRLVGRAGRMRLFYLLHPFYADAVRDVSRDAVRELMDREPDLDLAAQSFEAARKEDDARRVGRLEEKGRRSLEESIENIERMYRRHVCELAAELAEVEVLYARLSQRLHPGPFARLLAL